MLMKIVVLDGYTLNPGDLDWDELKSLGACEIHDRTALGDVVARSGGATVVLTNKTIVNRDHLFQLPELKYIGVLATGYNIVDVAAARERSILVTNVPAYGTRSVAQMTMALLLELVLQVGHHARTTREGRWTRSPDFSYWDFPLIELDGLTLGLVGLGRIGEAVAQLATAFGMKVLAARSRQPRPTYANIEWVELDEIFSQSDVISLHCPLTPATKEVVNAARIARMKPTAYLINTSRGPLIDEAALADALNAGRIAGAAVDVLSVEPPSAGNPLLTAKNCLVTPHIAWATRAARARLMKIAVANLRAYLNGELRNVVD